MACTQVRNGHVVAYACAGGDFVDVLERNGVEVFFLPEPHRNPWQLAAAFVALARIMRGFKPDIAHAHMAAQNVMIQPFRLLGLKTVTTIHNEFAKSAKLMGYASRIVSVSKQGVETMRKRGLEVARMRVVENGPVNSPRLPARFDVLELAHPAIVTVCGMHHRKGLIDLLHAFKIVVAAHPDAHLYLVGEGPSRQEYQALAVELGLGERTTFTGFREDPRSYLAGADIFVLASHADPGPLVIAEARNAGCAIVATNVDGIPEMLDFGAAGILVPPKDPAALAQALSGLIADPAKMARYALLAKQGTERFTIERVCRDMDVVYAEIAPRAAAPAVTV
jgi:glycosyltransferase involved in cell wall biosynthesis